MCKPNATITAASRPFLYDFTVTRASEPVPYRAFLHECCRYPQNGGDVGAVTGTFFGPAHEGMGGVIVREDLSAGFGGTR